MNHSVIKEPIVVIGYGWVGQANALALHRFGYDVSFFDIVRPSLKYPEYERDFGNISMLPHPLDVDSTHTVYLVCVGDRVGEDGRQDVSLIRKALESLRDARGTVVLRSTVLPRHLRDLPVYHFYMPEFLHEKNAVKEVVDPYLFVLGLRDAARKAPGLFSLLRKRSERVFTGTVQEASYIKYLWNIWNATRIAFVNEFGRMLKEPTDAQAIAEIERVVDFVLQRGEYLKYGRSFGGHCLPKDLNAFLAAHTDKDRPLLRGVWDSNEIQKTLEKEKKHIPEWFSFFTYAKTQRRSRLDAWLRRTGIRRIVVRLARPVLALYERTIPRWDLARTRAAWERAGQENPRFFMETKTKSGPEVDEFELREMGKRDYDRFVREDPWLRDRFPDLARVDALDIGCGIGRMTEFFADDFRTVVGTDIASSIVEIAEKRLAEKRNATVLLSDGTGVALADASCDVAFSYHTLQHMPTIESLVAHLKEVMRVLRPSGCAKLQVRSGSVRKMRWYYGVSLSEPDARALAESAGFRVVGCEEEGNKNLWLRLEKPAS